MIFKGRPFAGVLCIYIIATAVMCGAGGGFAMPAFFASLIVLTAAIICKAALKKNTRRIIYIAAPVFAAAFYFLVMYVISEKPILEYLDTYKDTDAVIRARVNKVTQGTFYTRFDLKVLEVDGKAAPFNFKLNLSVYEKMYAEIDDIIETRVIFKSIEESESSYGKPYGYFIAAEHALAEMPDDENDTESDFSLSSVRHTGAESHGYRYFFDGLQVKARDIFFKNVRLQQRTISGAFTQEAAIVYGIFTGNTSYIKQRIKTNFAKAGISHTLAVSGMHMSVLAGMAFSFLAAFNVHKKICCIFAMLCCILFVTFTGFSVSVLRSGIMLILYYSAFLVSSKSDPLTSLFMSGAVLCIISPYNCLNIGFQLSFLATLGMILSSELNNRLASNLKIKIKNANEEEKKTKNFSRYVISAANKIIHSVISSTFMTFAAILFTLPVTSYNFKTLSLISPLINLVTSPFITLILTFSVALPVVSAVPFLAFASFIFGTPLFLLTKFVLSVTNWGASLEYASISVSSTNGDAFYIFSVISLATVILFFFFVAGRKNKIMNIISVSVISLSVIASASTLIYSRHIFKDSLRIAYYSENRNQNILLFRGSGNKADIIDITDGTKAHIRPTYNTICENGAVDIDSVILTHYHKRHLDMIEKYLDYCSIDKIFVPQPKTEYDEEVFKALFDFSVEDDGLYRKKFELYMYQDVLDFENTAVIVNEFSYNQVRHMTVDIWHRDKKTLYLGLGYENMYGYIDGVYDVVLYGSHVHNRRNDTYGANIYATRYGVISEYTDNFGNKAIPQLGIDALSAYGADKYARLLNAEDERHYPVFELNAENELKLYLKKKTRK